MCYLYKQQLYYVVIKYHMYMNEEIEYYQISVLLKLIYKYEVITSKFEEVLLLKLDKISLDLIWNNEWWKELRNFEKEVELVKGI